MDSELYTRRASLCLDYRIRQVGDLLSLSGCYFKSVFSSVFRCHVFSIFPPASMPHFRLFAPVLSLPIANGVPVILCVTTTHVAVGDDSSTVLWNYVHDRWISWVAPLIRINDVRRILSNCFSTLNCR
jgi:hypothetical protein